MSPPAEGRRPSHIRAIGLVFFLLLEAAPAQPPELGWIDEASIQSGEILIDFGDDRRFRGRIRAATLVAAPPEAIWAVLSDCESAPEYLDSVQSCELIETLDGGNAQIFRQRAKLRWFMPSFEHEFRLDYEPYTRISVTRVSGPFQQLDGVWWLVPESPGRTRVIYRLDIEPGPLIPDFMLSRPLRRDVLNAMRAVRELSETNN
jgi:ribosome-associated toxin RatA of RatAB toxin-antitoxin module